MFEVTTKSISLEIQKIKPARLYILISAETWTAFLIFAVLYLQQTFIH